MDHLLEEFFNETQSRRTFLKKTAGGVFFLLLASLPLSGCDSYPKTEFVPKVFNNKQIAVLNDLADVIVETEENGLPSAHKLNVAGGIDDFVSSISQENQDQLRLLLSVFEDYAFLFKFAAPKFTKMSLSQKKAYLASWANSKLEFRQMAYSALKMLIMLVYYCQDDVWQRIGYSGPVCTGGT